MKTIVQISVLLILLAVACFGCTVTKQNDGKLGLSFGIDEKTHQDVQEGIDNIEGFVGGISSLFPALVPIASAIGVGGLTWRKMKKTVTKNKEPLKMLIEVLEHVKTNDQATWDKIRTQIKEQYPSIDVRGTIDEIKTELARQGKLVKAA